MSEAELQRIAEIVVQKLRATEPPKSKVYLSRKQAAAALGVSLPTLDRQVREGRITPKRLGTRIVFDAATL